MSVRSAFSVASRPRALRLVVIVVALALAASSCAGEDDGSSAAGPSVSTTDAQDTADHLLWSLDNETPGENPSPTDCSTGQPGGDRFFLPVWNTPGELETNCTVPSGAAVIMNIGGQLCWDEPDLETACRERFENSPAPATGAITVNGERSDAPAPVATPVFAWTPQPFWELGDDPIDAAFYGWQATVSGLPDGEHVIVTEFAVDGILDVTVTHNLTVG